MILVLSARATTPSMEFIQRIDLGQSEKEEIVLEEKCTTGIASWYDYDLDDYPGYSLTHNTAASRDLVRYSNYIVQYEGKTVTVRINDYGPDASVHPDRIIDLSSYAFKQLAPLSGGLITVEICLKK